ncbi:MAG: hypothetical protein EBE86_020805 [Hormoscilla sp. GUM202]|nr:hypothetical protein [Hormoscilla sp. GUM202]
MRSLQQEYQDMQLTEPRELLYSSPETAQRDAEALLLNVIGNRTLLLLVENLNDVFDGLGEQGQKQFRAFLQQNDCCTIVATSQSLFNGVKLRESPFYGFFGIRRLVPRLCPCH